MKTLRILLLLLVMLSNLKDRRNGLTLAITTPPTTDPVDLPDITVGENDGMSSAEEDKKVYLFVTAYSLVIFLIVTGNVGIAVTIMSSPELRKKTSELYLFSLVTARTMIGFFVVPARITGMFSEAYLGTHMCKLCHFCAGGSSVASIYSIVAIAGVKLYQVKKGQAYVKLPLKKALIIMACVWMFSMAYSIRYVIVNDMVSIVDSAGSEFISCTTVDEYAKLDRYFIIVDIIALFGIPLFVISFCYIQVINALTQNKIELSLSQERLVIQIDPASKTAIKMLIILVVLFTVCTGAPMILQLYKLFGGYIFEGYSDFENAVFIFCYSNAWVNVVIFAVFREDLRAAFCDLIKRRKPTSKNTIGVSPDDNKEHNGSMWDIMVVDGERWKCEKDECTIIGDIKEKEKKEADARKESVLMIEF